MAAVAERGPSQAGRREGEEGGPFPEGGVCGVRETNFPNQLRENDFCQKSSFPPPRNKRNEWSTLPTLKQMEPQSVPS